MMDKTLRHALPAREASERIKDFFEVSPGFSEQTALAEAARCLSCKNAPCMKGCPVGVHIPDFIAALRTEGAQAAAAVISADNNLPAVCGRVCPQENQCEKFCIRREKLGGSVSIGALERFVADHAPETEKRRLARVPRDCPALPILQRRVQKSPSLRLCTRRAACSSTAYPSSDCPKPSWTRK